MEDDSNYISSLIAKLYEKPHGSFTSMDESETNIIKEERDENENQPESKKRKVVDEEEEFFKNSSAAIIAESTEKTLKQMNIDPNSKEGKMQRRKIRNRMSAQIHRDRKKAYIDYLEDKVRKRDEVISILHSLLKKTQEENNLLRGISTQHQHRSDQGRNDVHHQSNADDCTENHPLPMTSPAESSTSTEHPDGSTSCGSSGSESSISPELEQNYFPDFDVDVDGVIDSKFFSIDNEDEGLWLPKQYQDLAIDLDLDQSVGDDEIMNIPLNGGNAGVGGGNISLFSLVMMMSFSFFSGLFSMGAMSGTAGGGSVVSIFGGSALDASSSILQPWTLEPSSFIAGVRDAEREREYSYGMLPLSGGVGRDEQEDQQEEGEVKGNDTLDISTDDTSNIPAVGGGRVLLSLSGPDEEMAEEAARSSSYDFSSNQHSDTPEVFEKQRKVVINSPFPSTISRSSAASLSSLWRQQNYHFIGTIYPPREKNPHQEMSHHENSSEMKSNRKYLRYRSPGGKSGTPNSTNTVTNIVPVHPKIPAQTFGDSDSEKSVTVYQQESSRQSSGSATSSGDNGHVQDEAPLLSSKILLSEGRVVLNPLLADLRTRHANKDSSPTSSHVSDHRSPDYDTDRALITTIPTMFDQSRLSSGESDDVGRGSNLLTMMIPASSIQWGYEWLDATSPDNSDAVMKHLLKNFNLTTYSDDDENTQSSSLDMSKLWLEIGCSVVDAKLVRSIS